VNDQYDLLPQETEDKGMAIKGNIADVLEAVIDEVRKG